MTYTLTFSNKDSKITYSIDDKGNLTVTNPPVSESFDLTTRRMNQVYSIWDFLKSTPYTGVTVTKQ